MVLLDTLTGKTHAAGDTYGWPRPPEAHEVRDLFKEYREYYRRFHANCRQEEDYYFGRNPIPIPQNTQRMDPTRPATATAIINVAADHVDVTNPTFFVPDPSPRAKDRAEKLKKFYQGAWMHVPAKVKRTAVRQQVAYGLTFTRVVWAPDLWPDEPILDDFNDDNQYRAALKDYMEARHIFFPIRVENVNPKNLVWDDSKTGIKWAIQFEDSTVGAVKKLYPEWVSHKPDHTAATYLEYWDDKWMGRMLDNDWVFGPIEHGYCFQPYVPVVPATSLDHDVGPPELRYRGINRAVHSLLDSEARLVTQYESILRQYAWRTLNFSGVNRQAVEKTADMYEISGAKNIILGGVTVNESPVATPPQEILGELSMVQTMIEEATFPNVVRGIRPSGISSGFGVSVLSGMGRLVFGPYADGMATNMSESNRRMAQLVENKAKGKITVRGRSLTQSFDQTIGPDDIRGFYENQVILKAEAPEEREREAILAERLYKAGMISLYEAMRRAGITNPLEEMNQIAAEQIVAAMRPMQVEAAAKGIGLPAQLASAGDVPVVEDVGNQFSPNLSQLQRPGEANLQQARVASQQGQPSVFPQGAAGIDRLGAALGGVPGSAQGVPSGQTIGR